MANTNAPTILELDAISGTETIRELTSEELSEIEESVTATQNQIAARTSALAKLAALGLTEEEIAAL
jgi:hypothetical protein